MKLTLRYLLAYMDDILRPNDAREVGKSLAQNKPASDLVQRIRGVIRMRRLSAPTALSDAPGQNANDVAEYLDNMMTPEDIRGFEQRCLESDEQLAEVGACHQILSHVIGRGVTMPHSTQLKLLQVASSIPVQPVSDTNRKADSAPETTSETKSLNSKPAPLHADLVPPLELRRSSTSWQKRAAILGVVLLAGIWFYSIVTDPSLRYDQELAGRSSTTSSVATPVESESGETAAATEQAPVSETPGTASTNGTSSPSPPPAASVAAATPAENQAQENLEVVVRLPQGEISEIDMADNTPAPLELASIPGVSPVGENRPASMNPPGGMPAGESAANGPAGGGNLSPVPENMVTLQEPVCFEPGVIYSAAESPVLVNLENQPNAVILQNESEVFPGTTLFVPRHSLAGFRMGSRQENWQLREQTVVQVLGADNNSCMGWKLEQGQMILRFPNPDPQAGPIRIRLLISGQTWLFELPTQATVLAVEAVPRLATHFEELPAGGGVAATLWVSGAPVRWLRADGVEQEVSAKLVLLPVSASENAPAPANGEQAAAGSVATESLSTPVETDVAPAWLMLPAASPTTAQRRDLREFARSLESSTNLWLDLQGMSNNPNPRIAQLASEALALGQQTEALVAVLAHSSHEESRTAAISGLRIGLARNPQQMTELIELLKKTFNEQTAPVVYRLLWGFNRDDARNAEISRHLVDGLRHEHVAVRELSIYWIGELTGQRLGYRPLAPVITREQGVASWERHLARVGALVESKK